MDFELTPSEAGPGFLSLLSASYAFIVWNCLGIKLSKEPASASQQHVISSMAPVRRAHTKYRAVGATRSNICSLNRVLACTPDGSAQRNAWRATRVLAPWHPQRRQRACVDLSKLTYSIYYII